MHAFIRRRTGRLALLVLSLLLLSGLCQPVRAVPEPESVPAAEAEEETAAVTVSSARVSLSVGEALALPETVRVCYGSETVDEPVVWDSEAAASVDLSAPGRWEVPGAVTLSRPDADGALTAETVCAVTVWEENLLRPIAGTAVEAEFTITGEAVEILSGEEELRLGWSTPGTSAVRHASPLTLEAGTYTFLSEAAGQAEDRFSLQVFHPDGTLLASGASVSPEDGVCQPSVSFTLEQAEELLFQATLVRAGASGEMFHWMLVRHEALVYEVLEQGMHAVSCGGCGHALFTETCDFQPQSAQDCAGDERAAFLSLCRCGQERRQTLEVSITGLTDQVDLIAGGTMTLVAGYQAAASDAESGGEISYTLSYESADESVLTVGSDGTLTAAAPGQTTLRCTVTASLAAGQQTLTCLAAVVEIPALVESAGPPPVSVSAEAIWTLDGPEDMTLAQPDGGGSYHAGETAQLTAGEEEDAVFLGWYAADGSLLSREHTYRFTVTGPVTCYAVYRLAEEESALPAPAAAQAAAPVTPPEEPVEEPAEETAEETAEARTPEAAAETAGAAAGTPEPTSAGQTSPAVHTGDETSLLPYLLLFALGAAAIGALIGLYLHAHRKK